jgi:hypothetical protein
LTAAQLSKNQTCHLPQAVSSQSCLRQTLQGLCAAISHLKSIVLPPKIQVPYPLPLGIMKFKIQNAKCKIKVSASPTISNHLREQIR